MQAIHSTHTATIHGFWVVRQNDVVQSRKYLIYIKITNYHNYWSWKFDKLWGISLALNVKPFLLRELIAMVEYLDIHKNILFPVEKLGEHFLSRCCSRLWNAPLGPTSLWHKFFIRWKLWNGQLVSLVSSLFYNFFYAMLWWCALKKLSPHLLRS